MKMDQEERCLVPPLPKDIFVHIALFLPDHVVHALWCTGRELHRDKRVFNHKVLPHLRLLQWHRFKRWVHELGTDGLKVVAVEILTHWKAIPMPFRDRWISYLVFPNVLRDDIAATAYGIERTDGLYMRSYRSCDEFKFTSDGYVTSEAIGCRYVVCRIVYLQGRSIDLHLRRVRQQGDNFMDDLTQRLEDLKNN